MRFLDELGNMASWEALGEKAAAILMRVAKRQIEIKDVHEEVRYIEVVGSLNLIREQNMGKVPA